MGSLRRPRARSWIENRFSVRIIPHHDSRQKSVFIGFGPKGFGILSPFPLRVYGLIERELTKEKESTFSTALGKASPPPARAIESASGVRNSHPMIRVWEEAVGSGLFEYLILPKLETALGGGAQPQPELLQDFIEDRLGALACSSIKAMTRRPLARSQDVRVGLSAIPSR